MHEDGLDEGVVGESPQPLGGLTPVADRAGLLDEARREPFGQVGAQAGGECGDRRRVEQAVVQALPELVEPVAGCGAEEVGEECLERAVVVVVAGAREPAHGRPVHRTMRWKARLVAARRQPSSS